MVLTVTINPLLERRLYFTNIKQGGVNRCSYEEFKSGGKGINVSRQLNNLDIKNMAVTFLGGNNGKILRSLLYKENIDFTAISTKNETRSAAIIVSNEKHKVTSYFGLNSEPSENEVNEFIDKLGKMIQNCSIAVFSGSSPSENANEIFPAGIDLANKFDKIAILDTYGNHLEECLKRTPFAVHNNVDEINNSLRTGLDSEESKVEFLRSLYGSGIKMAFLTDGANPSYVSKFDFHYKVDSPKINIVDSTGSGDAFVAGICYGLENNLVFEEMVQIASAMGAANAAKLEVCSLNESDYIELKQKIEISAVGKKMKLIDDSPNY